MERCIWKGRIKPGMEEEYIRRHSEIWPAMTENLTKQGIHNYSIWNCNNELIGYYECENLEESRKIKEKSTVQEKWNMYMKEIMEIECSSYSGNATGFQQIFYHD